jgi:uncharacterized Zn ribbon protein
MSTLPPCPQCQSQYTYERWAAMTDEQRAHAQRTKTRNPTAHRLEHMRRWYLRQIQELQESVKC